MPEFDTSRCIYRFAKDPKDAANRQAWNILQRQAQIRSSWEGFKTGGMERMDILSKMYLGAFTSLLNPETATQPKATPLTAEAMLNMESKERDDLYIRLCESVGLKVDPEALVNERKGTQQ